MSDRQVIAVYVNEDAEIIELTLKAMLTEERRAEAMAVYDRALRVGLIGNPNEEVETC